MVNPKTKKMFGDILVEGGLITPTQLHQALAYAREREIKLGMALQELGFVNELAVAKTLATQLAMPFLDLEKIVIDAEIVILVPELTARKYKVLAIGRKPGEMLVAFADPLNIFAVDEITRILQSKVVICVAVESRISAAIDRIYTSSERQAPLEGSAEESLAVSAVNDLLLQAVRQEASDIHLEPTELGLRARFRVDGIMRLIKEFPQDLQPSIVSRIKVMSQLDIGEKRKPQDGRFEAPVSGKSFDVRVSTLPTNYGEKIVMRLLDKSKVKIELTELGLTPEQQTIFEKHLAYPHEIILVTGPTGSGKTTTLYAALNRINSIQKNIITVEDPIEYELAGVNQVQVNPKAQLSFASALRSILRQDPDIIMIGEIRDVETAEIAIQAALTGHLVLSTLHTNDACGAISRLIDMSIPPFLIASALGTVIAQRLVRVLCTDCRESFNPPAKVQEDLGLEYSEQLILHRSKGCPKCDNSGYKGRIAIYEILPITNAIQALIMVKASSHELFRQAIKEGFTSLHTSGIEKLLAGVTSIDEVMRVTMDARE
ncbi:MAG: Flp pilus assembly complex ATPase component TadA [Proteobacteria bacterium]|nr:Flp pilus assembly complex ATPase component TadA [Pseudomonadota bacterium]MBU1688086.1 Flp pilus assembly complex ATPase component TadA [Pseudomonadota bacterium]